MDRSDQPALDGDKAQHLQDLLSRADFVNGPLDSELVEAALQGHTITARDSSMTLLAVESGQFAHEIHPTDRLDIRIPAIHLKIGHTSLFRPTDGARI